MKILIYSHFFAPSVGGVESIVLSLARGLADLRRPNGSPEFELTVVTATRADNFDDNVLAFRVVRQPNLLQLWNLIRSSNIVHIAGPALAPLFLSRLARKRVVVEHHGFQTICPNGQLFIEASRTPCPGHFMARRHRICLRCNANEGWRVSTRLWLLTFVRRFLCHGIAANIAPTGWFAGMLQLPKVVHISHGLACAPESQRPSGLPATPVVAFQGRLVSTKGVDVLLRAARILREQGRPFELLIIGDGPERSHLEELAKHLGLTPWVNFAGRLPAAQLDAALDRSTLLVVPSLGGEVFGLVLAENMLRGIPVLASDLGAFVEVSGGVAAIFRTGDAADLACQVSKLLDNPHAAASLGRLGRQRVLDFYSERRMIEEHARLY
jgi:glycosyltransferase involved in cell wall biosynthesis